MNYAFQEPTTVLGQTSTVDVIQDTQDIIDTSGFTRCRLSVSITDCTATNGPSLYIETATSLDGGR